MDGKGHVIRDAGPSRRYFTQIPNIVDDSEISVYAFRLYVHLKRVAGEDGTCWQSLDTLTDACRMSRSSVIKARDELEEAGFISVVEQPGPHGGRPYKLITITDIWAQNMAEYSTKNSQCSDMDLATFKNELKEEPIKNNNITAEDKPSSAVTSNGKTRDARLDHPAIKAYRSEARLHVPIVWRDEVISAVGEDENRVTQWRTLVHDWIGHGWNKSNIKGMITCFLSGGIDDKGGYAQKEKEEVFWETHW